VGSAPRQRIAENPGRWHVTGLRPRPRPERCSASSSAATWPTANSPRSPPRPERELT